MNLRIKSQQNEDNEYHFWKTCKAYRKSDFVESFNRLKQVLPVKALSIINNLDVAKWSRAYFPADRYNQMTSNSAESLNALSRHARKLPICMLIEFMRATTQKWYYERRKSAEDLDQPITEWASQKIQKRIIKGKGWKVTPIDEYRYEVRDNDKDAIINIHDRKCTCQVWQKSGLPCAHLTSVLTFLSYSDVGSWAQHWFKADNYKRTYTGSILPVGHPSEWVRPDNIYTINPPSMERRQAGRPKNKDRILSQGEAKPLTCDRCKKKGHTRKSCNAKMPEYQISSKASTSRRKQKSQSSQGSVHLYD